MLYRLAPDYVKKGKGKKNVPNVARVEERPNESISANIAVAFNTVRANQTMADERSSEFSYMGNGSGSAMYRHPSEDAAIPTAVHEYVSSPYTDDLFSRYLCAKKCVLFEFSLNYWNLIMNICKNSFRPLHHRPAMDSHSAKRSKFSFDGTNRGQIASNDLQLLSRGRYMAELARDLYF